MQSESQSRITVVKLSYSFTIDYEKRRRGMQQDDNALIPMTGLSVEELY
jgi:hypothetical protein